MAGKYDKEKLIADVSAPVNFTNKSFLGWMGLLSAALLFCLYQYSIQLREGLGVTGLGDYISWGMYIANFVFFVASSLIGMLISSVLGLIGMKWVTPISRIAEIIAIAFASVAGLVIVSDMGRPDRLINVFVYGRFQSPILWDITVVTTYVAISLLLYFLPLIPDLELCKNRIKNAPSWLQKIYHILSMNWAGTPEQATILRRAIRILLILIIPVALSIHTVTSWLFAVTSRSGWDSTIFGPYFVSGAFVAGCASVIIAMFFFRKNYKLHDYIEEMHFDKMGKLLVLVSLVYLYFNLNEYLVPGYKLKRADSIHLRELFTGTHAILFWCVQLVGLILPIILLLISRFRKPLPITIIAIAVLIGAWLKRYLIVVPTMEHPFLPIQHVPHKFMHYSPTFIEISITIASFLLVFIIITILSKVFPVLPIYEMTEEHEETEQGIHQNSSGNSKIISVLIILIALSVPAKTKAQAWTVPDDKKDKVSPFKFSDETRKKGAKIFDENCKSCHGLPTQDNYNKALNPAPGDPASDKFRTQTDGEIFFKITSGRNVMPSFADKLTAEERWEVISYIRSFHKDYVQPEPVIAPKGMFGCMEIKVQLTYLASQKQLKAKVTGYKDSTIKPLAGIDMALFSKRYFGNLQIDENKTTNSNGEALFDYKDSIPGDVSGKIDFIIRLNAEGLDGFKKEVSLNIGKPTNRPSLIATRAMWTVRSQAPIWLILTYSGVVLGVWLCIGYIITLIAKIRKAGMNKTTN